MLKEFRKTSNGTEYWDTEAKRIVIVGEDFAEGEDQTVTKNIKLNKFEGIDFDSMQVKELKEFAEQHGIDIPKSMTKKELVIERITGESND
ncbi:hypothetical protein [Rummeliibacillus sp. POC4]|uniref:hypothetical protein n=1 Tax=Rummeliibacillus sp. POC4 TaxID=2305899 RepID=UPI000E675BC3|nr:hypothetical protein [Rummeliibacillus sp. POC4]RIJ65520.1 hypothetical protein D1606_08090 [Rummeliibacillus sp. POC4]